jgi:hypothetical protein
VWQIDRFYAQPANINSVSRAVNNVLKPILLSNRVYKSLLDAFNFQIEPPELGSRPLKFSFIFGGTTISINNSFIKDHTSAIETGYHHIK